MTPPKSIIAEFGAITHHYASVEFGIKITLSAILDITAFHGLVLTEPHTSVSLRNVAKAIAKQSLFPAQHTTTFLNIIGEHASYGPLRNAIGHSRWTDGTRRYAFKPSGLDIRSGAVKWRGFDEDEKDWTAKELRDVAAKLYKLDRRLVQLLDDSGLTKSMARKDAEMRAAIDASLGSSNSAS